MLTVLTNTNSFYHALKIGHRKRFGGGISIQNSYTFAKNEVDTQWVTTKISLFNSRSTGFCVSIFKDHE